MTLLICMGYQMKGYKCSVIKLTDDTVENMGEQTAENFKKNVG